VLGIVDQHMHAYAKYEKREAQGRYTCTWGLLSHMSFIYIYIYIHTHTHTHIHIHTHTRHTCTWGLLSHMSFMSEMSFWLENHAGKVSDEWIITGLDA
jgi:hypothetical protein